MSQLSFSDLEYGAKRKNASRVWEKGKIGRGIKRNNIRPYKKSPIRPK